MRWIAALLLALAAACNPHRRIDVAHHPAEVPAQFTAGSGALAKAPWWARFEDPGLTNLVDRLLGKNLDLAQSWARLAQARSRAGQANAGFWPTVDFSAQTSRSKTLIPALGLTNTNNFFAASVSASYELDIWGRIDALDDAAKAEVQAAQSDVQAMAMTLVAAVAEAWYARAEQRALRVLLDEQLALNQTLLELTELRFRQGLAAAVDVLQQQDQIAALEAQRPTIDARIAVLENQLGALVGVAPGQLELPAVDALPALPEVPGTGVPAEVLAQRPDFRAAQARLAAADHRVAAAVADRFPALRLSGNVGLQAVKLSNLVDEWIWSIAASLVGPIFDGGRRAAEVELQEGVVRERLAGVGAVALTALREVQDALVQEAQQAQLIERLDGRVALARQVLEQSQLRYSEGVTDYLPVINAVRTLQALEQAQLGARRQRISFRIQLHRALGGDWQQVLRPIDPVAAK